MSNWEPSHIMSQDFRKAFENKQNSCTDSGTVPTSSPDEVNTPGAKNVFRRGTEEQIFDPGGLMSKERQLSLSGSGAS